MVVSNSNDIVMYDEYEWDESNFYSRSTLQDLLNNQYAAITQIIFYNQNSMICIKTNKDYYFRGINMSMLESLCNFPILHNAIRSYYLSCRYFTGLQQFPILMTIILGNTNVS